MAAAGAGLSLPREKQVPGSCWALGWSLAGPGEPGALALTNPALQAGTGSCFHHVWGVHADVEAQN